MKHPHVTRAIVILARFFLIVEWHIIQLGFLMYIPHSNGMFDALTKRPLMSPLAGMKHTYVRASHCNILKHFSRVFHVELCCSFVGYALCRYR